MIAVNFKKRILLFLSARLINFAHLKWIGAMCFSRGVNTEIKVTQ